MRALWFWALLILATPALADVPPAIAVASAGETTFIATGNLHSRAITVIESWGTAQASIRELHMPTSPDPTDFGRSMAFNGRTLFVGAPNNVERGSHAGAVHTFSRTQSGEWAQRQVLWPTGVRVLGSSFLGQIAPPKTRFGWLLAADADHALVGGRQDAVVFTLARQPDGTWHHSGQFEVAGVVRGLAISGKTAVVWLGVNTVQIFELDADRWRPTQRFKPDGMQGGDVAIHEDTIVIGAPGTRVGVSEDQGVAVIYTRGADGQWSRTQRLHPRDGIAGDRFGSGVAIDGDRLAVGATALGNRWRQSGIWLFERDHAGVWRQRRRFNRGATRSAEEFGDQIALGDRTIATSLRGATSSRPPVFSIKTDDFGSGPYCGDGIIDDDETCDDGNRQGDDGCGPRCVLETCGDGVQSGAEACDDGNVVSGDGCSAGCRTETCHVGSKLRAIGCQDDLSPNDRASHAAVGSDDQFGTSIAALGSTALIGAPAYSAVGSKGTGAAYFMQRAPSGQWRQIQKFAPNGGATGDRVGSSVALGPEYALVGAPGYGATGAVFVLTKRSDGWEPSGMLRTSASVRGFGVQVALDGNVAIVTSGRRASQMQVHIFERNASGAWSNVQSLRPPSQGRAPRTFVESALFSEKAKSASRFGGNLAVAGDTLWVSAARESIWVGTGDSRSEISAAGVVYVYRRNARGVWTKQHTLRSPRPRDRSHFGGSLAVRGNTAVIGSRFGIKQSYTTVTGTHHIPSPQRQVDTFQRGSNGDWHHVHTLVSKSETKRTWSTRRLALDDANRLLVTDPREASLQVYARAGQGWRLKRRIHEDYTHLSQFGIALAMAGRVALVGSYDRRTPASSVRAFGLR